MDPTEFSDWSAWEWNGYSGRYERYRQNLTDKSYQYESDPPRASTPRDRGADPPRAVIEDLTLGISNVSVNDTSLAPSNPVQGTSSTYFTPSHSTIPTFQYQNLSDTSAFGASAAQGGSGHPTSSYNVSTHKTTMGSFPYTSNPGGTSTIGYPSNLAGLYPPTGLPPTTIRTRNADVDYDELDYRYKRHPSKEFKFGRMFKTLWVEQYGGTGGTEMTVLQQPYQGQQIHQKMRRFVVIGSGRGFSKCVSVFTYLGRGTLKPGCHAPDHAVIYSGNEPFYEDGENGITKKPIKCNMFSLDNRLDKMSRLNYAKIYTVEHNVKVMFVGQVDKRDERTFIDDYNNSNPLLQSQPESSNAMGSEATSYAEGADPYYAWGQTNEGSTEATSSHGHRKNRNRRPSETEKHRDSDKRKDPDRRRDKDHRRRDNDKHRRE